jgi:putative membrane protein
MQDYFKLEAMKMMGGFGMGFMWIFWVGILVLAIALIWPFIKKDKNQRDSGNSSLDILKQRYARGEISKEEYEEKKRGLT